MPLSGQFPTTAWADLQHLRDSRPEDRRATLNRLLATYWKPVFYFLRARGYSFHQSEDLTQTFFAHLLQRDALSKADPHRGRFRTFLLTILTRFLSDQGPGRTRQKQFEDQLVSVESLLGDAERTYEPPTGVTPERVFMKQWAVELVQHVLQLLRQFYQDEGRTAWYEVFVETHYAGDADRRVSQQEAGRRHGMTRGQVQYALPIVEQRFVHLLRRNVSGQVANEADVGNEVRELLTLLKA